MFSATVEASESFLRTRPKRLDAGLCSSCVYHTADNRPYSAGGSWGHAPISCRIFLRVRFFHVTTTPQHIYIHKVVVFLRPCHGAFPDQDTRTLLPPRAQ